MKPDAKDDLKSLPLEEVENKLASSPDGLSLAEAQKRLTHQQAVEKRCRQPADPSHGWLGEIGDFPNR
jgi:Cation transporter/ATPase, N-terminus